MDSGSIDLDGSNCIRICPSVSELISTNDPIACPECGKSFQNQGALRLHSVKSHRQLISDTDNRLFHGLKSDAEKKLYYCPMDRCKFNIHRCMDHFRSMASLKQHFAKTHGAKTLACRKCTDRWFSMEKARRFHEKTCPGEAKMVGKFDPIRTVTNVIVTPPIIVQPIMINRPIHASRPDDRKFKDIGRYRKIRPKPIKKSNKSTQTSAIGSSRSTQYEQSDYDWSSNHAEPMWTAPSHETAACQTAAYDSDTTAVQSDGVIYNDFFCQTYAPPMADASVSADFRVSTGQQCPVFDTDLNELRTPSPPSDDPGLAWTHNETQTDLVMDDLFSDIVWHDMETQT